MIERIEADLKTALLKGDKQTVSTLKLVKSALKNKAIELGEEMDDKATQAVLRTELKKRSEAAEMYEKGEKQEAADRERQEAEIIQGYLPKQLSDSELTELIDGVRAALGDDAQMGTMIQEVLRQADGRADGKRVSEALRG